MMRDAQEKMDGRKYRAPLLEKGKRDSINPDILTNILILIFVKKLEEHSLDLESI